MSFAQAAAELGESEEHVRLLIEQGRLPNPPTRSSLRRYRQEAMVEANGVRIEPGTLRHLHEPGTVTVTAGIPKERRDRIDELAEQAGITRAAWIALAIQEKLDRT